MRTNSSCTFLAVFDPFDAQLVVDAEYDHAAAGVGQRNDFLAIFSELEALL